MARSAIAEERRWRAAEEALAQATRRLSAQWQDEDCPREVRELLYAIGTRCERDYLRVKARRESAAETAETLSGLALAAELAEAQPLAEMACILGEEVLA